MEKETCCKRRKTRTEEEYKSLTNRLSRIEGQIRGIRGMLEGEVYCIDILNQVSAASSALASFSRELISQHLKTCVANDLANGGHEKADEVADMIAKLMK